jgi:hypothetical protein
MVAARLPVTRVVVSTALSYPQRVGQSGPLPAGSRAGYRSGIEFPLPPH